MNDSEGVGRRIPHPPPKRENSVQLSVCIPAHNESATIDQTVEQTLAAIPPGTVGELVLIDDASTDDTLAIMNQLVLRHPNRVRVVALEQQKGLGGALQAGLRFSVGELVTWLPADGEYAPRAVLQVIPPSTLDDKLIIFQRTSRHQPTRNFLSNALYFTLKILFGVRLDDYCGIFIVNRRALENLQIESTSTVFTIELLIRARQLNWHVSTHQIEWKPREHGKSSVFTTRGIATSLRDLVLMRKRSLTEQPG